MNSSKPWPMRKVNTLKIRADSSVLRWLEREYPTCSNPERLRRVKDRLESSENVVKHFLKNESKT